MIRLIVGLGNVGGKYENTRHNIGFRIIDRLAFSFGLNFKKSKLAFSSSFDYKGNEITLIKPTTLMNKSGIAVSYYMNQLEIKPENILVLTDDIHLPFGKIRFREKGSDGGHNGLKSINNAIKSKNYNRLKFGIGKDFKGDNQIDYVLGKWNKEEKENISFGINTAIDNILSRF